ncbi:MAG: formate dehydrogenase subunit alpha [Acidiferrobacteraceae bacterium]|nr:formate dehydrogenase subunit alpha [Acidiferrobacteraceae bacterium]
MTTATDTSDQVSFTLNDQPVTATSGETILQAARRNGVDIPHLCYADGLATAGNCRACVVEIDGERVLAPSCCRAPTEGMKVSSNNARARRSQSLVLELLRGEVGEASHTNDSELDHWCGQYDLAQSRFGGRHQPKGDLSHPAIAVNMESCIQCTRCVRACREEQNNDVIGLAFRGAHAQIVFDLGDDMGASSCVGCGECVQACPTGALMPAGDVGLKKIDKKVDSVCPYCGVGCLLTYHVKDNEIQFVTGRNGPANKGRLCVKGRYGFDYVSHPDRLTQPMIRKEGVPKGLNEFFDPTDPSKMFRPATWEEALDHAAQGLKAIKDSSGPKGLAGFGSAKGSNEEAYLFQKLVRTGFGTNNVDHCTRLCHASSVAALLEGIGSGAVSNQVEDAAHAEVIVVIGANPTGNHPVAATFIKNAARRGATLIVMDPRRTELARHAEHFLQFKADTDVALLNAMIHTIIDENLVDEEFIASRTNNFEELKERVKDFSPEEMAPICGIEADVIRACARAYATSKASIIFWGMGISQHVHGTDNARCLIALSLMTGQIGRPGTGLHPLRGQNNVQGASDAGLIPMMFPDYRRVDNTEASEFFSKYWHTELDPNPGLTVVEIMDKAYEGEIRGMYIMGENPAMSDPDLNHSRAGLAALDHMVLQDIFLTETAAFANVLLPASAFPEKTGTFSNTDRRVQVGRQALDCPGEARQDLWIIQELANRLGLDWNYPEVKDVFEEMRGAMPSIAGMTWERLETEHSITYPCEGDNDPGQGVVFIDDFPTGDGRGKFVPASLESANELPDTEYPFVLITGRQLEHWHTGSMTRRSQVLNAIEPEPVVSAHPDDLDRMGVVEGGTIKVASRRGEVVALARADRGMRPGEVFIPFCYHEAAANLLTNAALDPVGKIAEVKYCAVRVSAA